VAAAPGAGGGKAAAGLPPDGAAGDQNPVI
jgi:hypothetical protein